jgi:DNA-binding XRE family transcriptional regulator
MLPLTGDGLLSQTTFVKSGKAVPARRRVKPTLTVFDQFNVALVSLRERRHMRQAQVIEAAGLSPRTVGSAEKGENIRIDTLDAMLAAMALA